MHNRLITAFRRLFRIQPERQLCPFERRLILKMVDAGVSHRTLIRKHGYTELKVDRAIMASGGR